MEVLDKLTLHFDQSSLLLMNICLATVMFGIALELTVDDFRRLLIEPKAIAVGLTAQVVLLPAVTFLLIYLINPTTSVALGMLLVASCPGGNLSNLYAVLAKGNGALSVSLTAMSTLLSVITTPLNFSFWAELYGQSHIGAQEINLSVEQMLITLSGVVFIPLVLGIATHHYFVRFSQRILLPIRVFSIIILMVFIVSALAANFALFLQYIHLLLLLVLAHNAVAYIAGYSLSAVFGLNTRDRKTITLETGIQNSGLALIIIFNFFDGLGGMAFLAGWWGIWDMVSGLLLAWVLSKTKNSLVR